MLDASIFQMIMDNDPNMVFIKDKNSIVLYGNQVFFNTHAPEQRDKLIGFTGIENFPADEAELFLAEDQRAIERGFTEIVEEITDYTGKTHIYLTRKIGFEGPQGEPLLLGIATDITELSEREKNLVQANEQLKKYTALAAHDLRSPLASIVSALECILHDQKSTLSANAKKMLGLAIISAAGLTNSVSSLLSVSRAENVGELEFKPYNLNLLIEEVRFNLSELINRTVAAIYSSRLPTIPIHADLFRQMFQNLIENSIKYRTEEPPQIIIRYEATPEHHCFIFEDNGRGISEEKAKSLFNMFTRGDSTVEGTGIGLALCQRIARLHGGEIAFDTNYDKGCRVKVTVPTAFQTNFATAV